MFRRTTVWAIFRGVRAAASLTLEDFADAVGHLDNIPRHSYRGLIEARCAPPGVG